LRELLGPTLLQEQNLILRFHVLSAMIGFYHAYKVPAALSKANILYDSPIFFTEIGETAQTPAKTNCSHCMQGSKREQHTAHI
jgi:hypothetical protein